MTNDPRPDQTADLSQRMGSAVAQAIRKTFTLTGTIPTKARTASIRVRFEDGRSATYTLTLKRVGGAQ